MSATQDSPADDVLLVIEDDKTPPPIAAGPVWRILIVDDDDQVHRSTVFALSGKTLLGRTFAFEHARSAAAAAALLNHDRDFAVILLDVVMETEHAGLDLIRVIRDGYGMLATRIVLRTGHPGYLPELDAIQNYDINDYRTKSEMTEVRLMTTIASALRSYTQIQTIEASRAGLRRIVDASPHLFRRHRLTSLAEGVLGETAALLGAAGDGVVLARPPLPAGGAAPPARVIAAAGRLAGSDTAIAHAGLAAAVARALDERRSQFDAGAVALHVATPGGDELVIGVLVDGPPGEDLRQLLAVFSVTAAAGLDSAMLFERTESLAFGDALTGLPNRAGFQRAVKARLLAGGGFAVFLVDLDGFEDVNDGLGHEAGDRLLCTVARLLGGALGPGRDLARLSSDTFAFLHPMAEGEQAVIDAVQLCFAESLPVLDSEVSVTATIGYCIAEPGDRDPARLLRRAGMALKRAKRTARGRAVRFAATMEEELYGRLAVIGRLRGALATGQFSLHYQPQVRLAGLSSAEEVPARLGIAGVEALLRWRRPDGSMVAPNDFIPMAEDSGRIVEIGEWVLDEACRIQGAWRAAGLPDVRMAVNVSIRQLKEPGYIASVERTLSRHGAAPSLVELEITETLEMEEEAILRVMNGLRELGVRLAIDDFGIGYSSLSRLRRLPVDHLKIDRSFVTTIGDRPECRVITAMIVNMARSMGLATIAEGVETVEQQQELVRLGCGQAQGYLYARPQPAEAAEAFLRRHR